MKVNVGNVKSDLAGFNNIARIAAETQGLIFDSVQLDFSSCEFFEANMTSPLFTVISNIRDNLSNISVVGLNSGLNEILRKNNFMSQFHEKSLVDETKSAIPFKVFKLHAGEQFFEYLELYMYGKGMPKMSKVLKKRFKQSLFEIFQNAAIHSKSPAGIFTCGQFFSEMQRLDFSISDSGVGIRENVRNYTGLKKMSSRDAIKWALTEGNTTKTGEQPGGLGLKLLKEFIRMNNGKLQIVSRLGYYEFSSDGENYEKLDHDFPGTCVNIEINTQDTNSYCLRSELSSNDIF
jgi:signal transduction histidine kinase